MNPIVALLIIAAAPSTAGADGDRVEPRGVQIASAQVQARILRPAIVRQASGPRLEGRDGPAPQISRRGGTVLVEYQ